jgi:parvulin-like peptidyl-prolyl isomerase
MFFQEAGKFPPTRHVTYTEGGFYFFDNGFLKEELNIPSNINLRELRGDQLVIDGYDFIVFKNLIREGKYTFLLEKYKNFKGINATNSKELLENYNKYGNNNYIHYITLNRVTSVGSKKYWTSFCLVKDEFINSKAFKELIDEHTKNYELWIIGK